MDMANEFFNADPIEIRPKNSFVCADCKKTYSIQKEQERICYDEDGKEKSICEACYKENYGMCETCKQYYVKSCLVYLDVIDCVSRKVAKERTCIYCVAEFKGE